MHQLRVDGRASPLGQVQEATEDFTAHGRSGSALRKQARSEARGKT